MRRVFLILAASLIIALIVSAYFGLTSFTQDSCIPDPTPTPNPAAFDYYLEVSSVNDTVLQENSININVTISYLRGDSENITLAVSGIPVNLEYVFSQSQGFPTENKTFNSVLTLNVPKTVPTDSYSLTINSTAENGKSHSFPYTLFVLESGILVSGKINGDIGEIPTEIIFRVVENSGEITHRFSTLVEEGNYEISLPNNKFFYVSVPWEKLDGTSGIHHFIFPYHVNAGIGVTSINCPFSWGT